MRDDVIKRALRIAAGNALQMGVTAGRHPTPEAKRALANGSLAGSASSYAIDVVMPMVAKLVEQEIEDAVSNACLPWVEDVEHAAPETGTLLFHLWFAGACHVIHRIEDILMVKIDAAGALAGETAQELIDDHLVELLLAAGALPTSGKSSGASDQEKDRKRGAA